jgi:REP element-mobilizing transposase RayT
VHLFGDIFDGQMQLNDAGRMVQRWYSELERKFSDIRSDAFVCMPNHVHFIVENMGKHKTQNVSIDEIVTTGEHTGSPLRQVVQWFKTMTTNEYIRCVHCQGWRPFVGKLWQRNYYEHIVHNTYKLNQIREYIANNPVLWREDDYYA